MKNHFNQKELIRTGISLFSKQISNKTMNVKSFSNKKAFFIINYQSNTHFEIRLLGFQSF